MARAIEMLGGAGADGARPLMPRSLLLLHLAWAGALPIGQLYAFAYVLPASSFGFVLSRALGFLLFWFAAGVALWGATVFERKKLGRRALLTPAAGFIAIAATTAMRSLPWEWTTGLALERTFRTTEIGPDADVVPVPGDGRGEGRRGWQSPGYGLFVREDAARSDESLACLSFEGVSLFVLRERDRLSGRRAPDGMSSVMLFPMDGGWWYVAVNP